MEPTVMITNGGPHLPETWAEMTCGEIIQIPAESQTEQAKVGRMLELKIMEVLIGYHEHVIAAENAQLDADGDGRLESPIDGQEHDPEDVIQGIQAAAASTPWAAWFDREEVKQRIRDVLAKYASLAMDVERSWYVDRNPTEAGSAWQERRAVAGPMLAHTFAEEK